MNTEKKVELSIAETEELILIMLSRDPLKLHNGVNFLNAKKQEIQPNTEQAFVSSEQEGEGKPVKKIVKNK